ncbi:MAG TPA: hypothetical protein VFE15_15545 [Marmoricola sp.]|jgi:hypothetical protein|nr:hypothetical protein [Marmoricola sp.]
MVRVVLNPAGLSQMLQTEGVRDAIEAVGEQVADNVRAQGITVGDENGGPDQIALPVEVHGPELSRSRPIPGVQGYGQAQQVVVSLAHAAGEAVQAKHGALTKAAAQAGLRLSGGEQS